MPFTPDPFDLVADALRDWGATTVTVVQDGTCFHVFTGLQDLDSVFGYADDAFPVFDPPPGRRVNNFLDPKQNQTAIRRTRFLTAVMFNLAFAYSDINGNNDPLPCSTVSLATIGNVRSRVKDLNAKTKVKIDIGGEGRSNKDRININICGRGIMGSGENPGDTKGKKIPRLVPKTKGNASAPFPDGVVDEVWIVHLLVESEVFEDIVKDAGRVLKPGGKLFVEGPCDLTDRHELAVKVLETAGYKNTFSDMRVKDATLENEWVCRRTITIISKP